MTTDTTAAGLVERLKGAAKDTADTLRLEGYGQAKPEATLYGEAADRIAELEKELAEAKQRHEAEVGQLLLSRDERATAAETSRDNALKVLEEIHREASLPRDNGGHPKNYELFRERIAALARATLTQSTKDTGHG